MTFASLLPELGKWLVEPVKLTARARMLAASRRATESLAEFCVRLLTEHGVSASVQRTPDEEAIEALLASLPREVPE